MGQKLNEKITYRLPVSARSREGTEIAPELKAGNNLLVETAKHDLVTHHSDDITLTTCVISNNNN